MILPELRGSSSVNVRTGPSFLQCVWHLQCSLSSFLAAWWSPGSLEASGTWKLVGLAACIFPCRAPIFQGQHNEKAHSCPGLGSLCQKDSLFESNPRPTCRTARGATGNDMQQPAACQLWGELKPCLSLEVRSGNWQPPVSQGQ